MSSIGRWTIFSLLDERFVGNIRTAIVFGSSANEAIIVSNDDQVYGLGTNSCSCLGICNGFGLGSSSASLSPIRIESLCGKGIVGLAFGSGPHVLALSRHGHVYAWGHNSHAQLGNGTSNPGLLPSPIGAALSGHPVKKVACGNRHCLAVTEAGEVFGWGDNTKGQVGTGTLSHSQTTPRRVSKSLLTRVVWDVCCGQDSSLAVTDRGELFAWGGNDAGQLGVGTTNAQPVPQRVLELQSEVISQVASGYAHSLALSDQGALFAWGSNSCGQLGLPDRANQTRPLRTAKHIGRVVDIGAVHTCNISAVRCGDGIVWMWGQWPEWNQGAVEVRGQSQSAPVRTPFSVLDDAFACFATPPVSCRHISFAAGCRESVGESVRVAFDDSSTADVAFEVEGRVIHAHSAILRIRSPHLRSMLTPKQWSEGSGERIVMREYSYPVFRAFLAWLYTDRVDLAPEDAVGLLDLANSYCDDALKEECASIIRRGITTENAVLLFAAANKFSASSLENFCFHFCLNHMTAVVKSDAFQAADEHSVKLLISQAATAGCFRH